MADPAPVTVENVVKTESVDAPKAPPVTAQTTTKTEKTEVVSGPPQPPALIADDKIRTEIARYVIFSDTITCLVVLFLLFYFGGALSKDVLAIVATIIGSIIGYRARDTGTVIAYEFGSSSGSTAKSAILDKK